MKKIISLLFIISLLLFGTLKVSTVGEDIINSVEFILQQNNDMILSKQYNFNAILKDQKISIIEKNNESIFGYAHNKFIMKYNSSGCATSPVNITKQMLEIDPNPLSFLLQNTLARSDKKSKMRLCSIRGPCGIWNSS